MEKIIGIIGGMGPEAGLYFHQKIIERTTVKRDQDHLEVLLHTNSRVPDRTRAILLGEESPVNEINRSIKILENSGANVILIACVTAHHFVHKFSFGANTKFINIIDLSASHISSNYSHIKKIGVLATSGTIKSNFIPRIFASYGLEVETLDDTEQEQYVMSAIYGENGIKNGNKTSIPKDKLVTAANLLKQRKCQAILEACTEIPLVLKEGDVDIPLFDVIEISARYIAENGRNM